MAAVLGLLLVLLTSCSLIDNSSTPASQGSLGSCHSFVVANMYGEKLKQNGMQSGLSEKDIFLRVYFQGITEEHEILRQLTISADRRLPAHYREGSTLKQVAGLVKKHGVLSRKEDPYAKMFKSSLPVQIEKLRVARRAVFNEASATRSRLGRSLTRAETKQIVDNQYAKLHSQGVIQALQIKSGNRSQVKNFAGNFVYKEVDTGRSVTKLPHIVRLLEQGNVGAGLGHYPWSKGGGPGASGGHTVILNSYDAEKKEFVITNPWWLGSFGVKHYDRVDAREFMSYLEMYGWLHDTRPLSARRTVPVSVAKTTKAKGQRVAGRTGTAGGKSGKSFLERMFGKLSRKGKKADAIASTEPGKVVKAKKKAKAVTKVAKPDKSKGWIWNFFNKSKSKPVAQSKPKSSGTKSRVSRKKETHDSQTTKPKSKGMLWKLFHKPATKQKKRTRSKASY